MGTVFFHSRRGLRIQNSFPTACDYLLGLGVEGGFQTLYDAEDYLNLIIMIMLGLGIVFQIPTLSYLLARIGLLTPRMMWKSWRYAVVIIMIIAAVLTPTADAINMTIFAAPMLISISEHRDRLVLRQTTTPREGSYGARHYEIRQGDGAIRRRGDGATGRKCNKDDEGTREVGDKEINCALVWSSPRRLVLLHYPFPFSLSLKGCFKPFSACSRVS